MVLNLAKPTYDNPIDIEVFNANSTAIEGAFEDLDERLTLCETEEEIGTFTPVISTHYATGPNQSPTVTGELFGTYVKRGKLCYVTIASSSNFLISNGVGNLIFRGLPFVPSSRGSRPMTGIFAVMSSSDSNSDAGELSMVNSIAFSNRWGSSVGSPTADVTQPLINGKGVSLPLSGTNHQFVASFTYII